MKNLARGHLSYNATCYAEVGRWGLRGCYCKTSSYLFCG